MMRSLFTKAFEQKRSSAQRGIVFIVGAFLLFDALPVRGQKVPEIAVDLMAHVQSIRAQMPSAGSNGFALPSVLELKQWRALVKLLLREEYDRAVDSLAQNFPSYRLLRLRDLGYHDRISYMLQEAPAPVKGWGTYWFSPDYARELSLAVPHPIYDAETETEAVAIFRETDARALLLAGTHRCAHEAFSPCDGSTTVCNGPNYRISDVAHATASVFQNTHEELVTRAPNTFSLNLHGHSSGSCPDFFLSNGALPARQVLFDLKSSLLAQGEVSVAAYGESSSTCDLAGTTNVQGRFQNGSSNPCSAAARVANGYFIHLEQSRRVRETPNLYAKLIFALKQSIPTNASQVTQPSALEAQRRPESFRLLSIHPNPFTRQTEATLEVSVITTGLRVTVYDLQGQAVRALQPAETLLPNQYSRKWDGCDETGKRVANGVYIFRAHAGRGSSTTKVLLLRHD